MTGGGSTTGERAKERRKKYRLIYDTFCDNPRIIPANLASILQKTQNRTEKLIEKAISEGFLYYPQIRKRSYQNTKEYTHFLKTYNGFQLYIDLIKDNRISYHAYITGHFNLWLITNKKIPFKDSIFEGYRTDYHFTKAPDQSWDTGIKNIHAMIDSFDPKEYEPVNYCQSHLHEKIYFPPEYEIMYQYFKFNLRKPLTPLMADHKIPMDTINQFLGDVPKLFTVTISYYPEGIESYEPWLFKIDTKYHDFIIDLFSELPTTSLHFKVKDSLFTLLFTERELIRTTSSFKSIEDIHIPWTMHILREKGIIDYETHGLVNSHWNKWF